MKHTPPTRRPQASLLPPLLALIFATTTLACSGPASQQHPSDQTQHNNPDSPNSTDSTDNTDSPDSTALDAQGNPVHPQATLAQRLAQTGKAQAALNVHKTTLQALPGVLFLGIGEHSDGSGRIAVVIWAAGPTMAGQIEAGLPEMDALVDVVVQGEDPPSDGHCTHEGKRYPHGSRVPVDCNTCRCVHGQLRTCTLKACIFAILDKIHFDSGSRTPKPSDLPILDKLALILKNNPKLTIAIHGHTSASEASTSQQKTLSQQRAEAVRDYLFSKGAPPASIANLHSHGFARPLAPNQPQRNQRVSFTVVTPP